MSLWGEWQKCSLPQLFPVVFFSFKAGILRIWSLWSRKLLLGMTFFSSPFLSKPKIVPVQNQSEKKEKILTSSLSKESKEKRGQGLFQRWKMWKVIWNHHQLFRLCIHRWVKEVLQPVLGQGKPRCSERTWNSWCCDTPLKWARGGAAAAITKQQCRDCGILRNTRRKSWGRSWMDFPFDFVRGMGW